MSVPIQHRPWSRGQVRLVDSWPTRRDQPVSVALSPAGDRLALSVGQRLSVLDITDGSRATHHFPVACSLAPGLTWSPDGGRLAYRDDDGQGWVADLSGEASQGTERRMSALGQASAMAFFPHHRDRLAVLEPTSPGRMTLMVIGPNREPIWEEALTSKRDAGAHPEGVNLALSPSGHLLACTTGTSAIWVFDTATGQQVRRFDDHTQTVTGVSWIDDERLLSASTDATLRVSRLDDSVSSSVVETIAAEGMVFIRARGTALIWSARGELLAWSLEETPAQLWDREPPSRSVAAHFTRLAVSAVDGLLALIDAGAAELLLVSAWESVAGAPPATTTYANAKVLLLGDSGVGKSGLAMVLAGREFTPTESTHGRRIWLLQTADPAADEQESSSGSRLEPAGYNPPAPSPAGLTSVFEGCIARLESAGLVKRLKFGDYVLLQPELLDAYAGAMVNAARDESDGLGGILETTVVNVDFPVPAAERVRDRLQERLLVLASLEELLLNELVLREPTKDGVQLVFPSAYRRDLPTSEIPQGDGVLFRFQGPIENIYATLIVRLTRSDRFRRVDTWQSAARFASEEGTCIVALKFEVEGEAELLIGCDRVPDDSRKQFERFVHTHLERWATPGTITRERQYSCPDCRVAFTSEMVRQVNRRGRLSILCPVCEERVPLWDDYEANGTDQSTAQMDASADAGREIEAATAVLRGKTAVLRGKADVAEYDVFLSYHWPDKDAVRALAQQLRNRGLRPWMDERQLRPGVPWQPEFEEIIARVPAAAVVIGAERGPWQTKEIYAFIQQSVSRGCAIVPVLLPDADTADLPIFLQGLTWVNLAVIEPDPIDQLVWGVTGQQLNR